MLMDKFKLRLYLSYIEPKWLSKNFPAFYNEIVNSLRAFLLPELNWMDTLVLFVETGTVKLTQV